jgi:hypothetical protein
LLRAGVSGAEASALVSAEFAAFFSDPARIDAAFGPVMVAVCASHFLPQQLCTDPPSVVVQLAAVGGSPPSPSPAATSSPASSLVDGWELIAVASGGAFILGTVCALAACAVRHASRRIKVAPAPIVGDGSGVVVAGSSAIIQSTLSVPVGASDDVVVQRVIGNSPAVLPTRRGADVGAVRPGDGVSVPAMQAAHEWQPLPGAIEPGRSVEDGRVPPQ